MSNRESPGSTEERLMQAARRLPDDISPRRDLWSSIATRIAEDDRQMERRNRWRPFGMVAAALALVAVSSVVTIWVTDDPAPRVVHQIAPGPMAVAARSAPMAAGFGAGVTLGPRYERARQELTRDLEGRLEELPEPSRALVERNLDQIRAALAEINTELSKDPNNVLLQQLLLAAYQDELAVLMNVNKMVQTLPTRTEI